MAEHAHREHHAHGENHGDAHGTAHEPAPVKVEYHERVFANFIRIGAWHVVAIFGVLALLAITQT